MSTNLWNIFKTNEIDKQDFRAFDHLKDKKLTIVGVSSTGFIQMGKDGQKRRTSFS
jgi:hypothetical protein